MKKNIYLPFAKSICLFLLLPALMTACSLYEEPELTQDGEPGIDPTGVNVNIALSLQLDTENITDNGTGGISKQEIGRAHV